MLRMVMRELERGTSVGLLSVWLAAADGADSEDELRTDGTDELFPEMSRRLMVLLLLLISTEERP